MLFSLHESLVPHPCYNLMGRRPEIKNLPETSNSSLSLPLHRALLQAHFLEEKKAEKSLLILPLLSSHTLWLLFPQSPPSALPQPQWGGTARGAAGKG